MSILKPSFEDFYLENYGKVYRYIRKRIHIAEETEDLTQTVFEYCYKSYELFDPVKSSISTWLYLIVNSRLKNYYRGRKESDDIGNYANTLFAACDEMDKTIYLEELKKANPNMGVSVSADFFREEIAVAEMSASKKAEFLTKYCNIKQNSSIAWLDAHVVEGAAAEITLEAFRKSYAVGGIDLSQTTDLTAATVVVERGGKLYAFTQFFMPANRVERATAIDGVPYDIFVKKGVITLSGENHVDYKDVFNWFVMLKEKYQIYVLKVGYDRYSAQYLVDEMKAYGFHMDDVFQGENLAPVIREFEGILLDGNFKIADNSLLKAHFLNVALKHNMETRKFRPVKIEQRARIDGFVSVIDAMTVRQKYYNEIGVMLKNAG